MELYLSIHSLPELKEFSRKERNSIYRRHMRKAYRHWPAGIFAVLYMNLFAFTFVFVRDLFPDETPSWKIHTVQLLLLALALILREIGQVNWTRPYIKEELDFYKSKGLL